MPLSLQRQDIIGLIVQLFKLGHLHITKVTVCLHLLVNLIK